MRRLIGVLALASSVAAPPALAADFPDSLVIHERLGGWPRDNGGGRLMTQSVLARIVDESGATLFEELHCDIVAAGQDAELELALGTVDPAANPLDLRFDGPWSVRLTACDEAACDDGIPVDPLRCDGDVLLDKPLAVVAYAWRAKYTDHADSADHALFADDCDRLDGLDSSDFMPAGTDLWVNETGDTMTGPLVLPADPTEDAQAATKRYVDDQIRAAIPRGYAILGPNLVSPPGFAPSGAYIATDGEWETLAPLPTPAAVTATVLDGMIHARTEVGIVQVYDPATNSWTPTNGPGAGQAIVNLDGALHLVAIDNAPHEHWERPAGSMSWRRRAIVPEDRVDGVVVSGGILHALAEGRANAMSLWAWDPATDSWTRETSAPGGINRRTLVDFQGSVWALGGWLAGGGGVTNHVDFYDPGTGRWAEAPPMKRQRPRPAAAVVAGRLYVFGGEGLSDGVFLGDDGEEGDSVEVFDPAVGAWTILSSRVPASRSLRFAVALNGRIHAVGGARYEFMRSDYATDVHEAFTPQQRWYVHVKQ